MAVLDSTHFTVQLLPWTLAAVSTAYAIYLKYQSSKQQTGECSKHFNTKHQKSSPKVVNSFDVEDLDPKTCFCRCWQSKKFPYCDGSHNEYNNQTGDNLGPLILQKK